MNTITVSQARFQVEVLTIDGERFASVRNRHDFGADFYESGEEIGWSDGNSIFANCSPSEIAAARAAAKKALA